MTSRQAIDVGSKHACCSTGTGLGLRHDPAHPRRRARRSRVGELGLDVYPNQIEIITAEQMLDAYASIGMPLFYKHWSFGKHFAQHEAVYRGA